ncbi:hypothetical protein BG011_005312 [Mortierella polycephala]|uniref:Uncharacterized protein n=1 Tax=Mortierella polycephala TaxID=41804 RepID=A0A9P6U137_9FUNG|nr:hypothetical protein BG011_005312 [Mortierella polycephala]
MPQLLESTRNYLRSSTKIGRRLSNYSTASEASFQDIPPASLEDIKQQQQQQQYQHQQLRPSPQKRLSALFTLEGRNRSSTSSEGRTSVNMLPHKIRPEAQEQLQPENKKKRKSSSSRKSTLSQHQPTPPPQHRASKSYEPTTQERPLTPMDPENEVPRGRSPTLSFAPTMHTVASAASSYDTRPSDYPSMKHYQSHLWRRTLLEESIMHSLRLGYAGPSQQQDDSRTQSPKSSSKDLPPCPESNVDGDAALLTLNGSQEHIVERSMPTPNVGSNDLKASKEKRSSTNNSPYQMLLNPSTTNITQSYASFTLELPEHQVSHVMSASVIPNLFRIKSYVRARRNSNASRIMSTGYGPSPRVLTGKPTATALEESKANMNPHLALPAIAITV